MASGSSSRPNTGSKGFDFASDDILCSYEDYGGHDQSNGGHNDGLVCTNSSKDFHRSRVARSSAFSASYSPPDDSFNQDVTSTVEKSMKKYTDNLMRFLEGISSRMSQLELYCYNLDKSIGEMRSDLVRDHEESESKLKSIEKHLQEVHRSVQILRDKQELAETQKELAKLQLAQKESSGSSQSQSIEERSSTPASDHKKTENSSDTHNQQLALALPHQVAPVQQPVATPAPAPLQNLTQQQSYYVSPTQFANPPAPTQHPQTQYLPADPQYRTPQLQDMSQVVPQQTHSQVSQAPQLPPFSQYQQQWPQHLPPQVQPLQQPPTQTQVRLPPTSVYPPYPPSQPTNSPVPETLPSSVPMQVPFSSVPQPGSSRVDTVPYGYAGAGRTVPQRPPLPQIKSSFGAQAGDVYAPPGSHPALPPGSSYVIYDREGSRTHNPPQQAPLNQGGYTSSNSVSYQNLQPTVAPSHMIGNPGHSQFTRNHPYRELIEKLGSMGFRSDHVASVIERMEGSGQPIDFNSVLDRLNAQPSANPQRGW